MSVSDVAREKVKNRCGGMCQLFHREPVPGSMIVHAYQHQGIGGRPEESEVNQPKYLLFGCPKCHDLIDARREVMIPYQVLNMDADHVDADGNPDPILDMLDAEQRPVPHSELWLFMHHRRQELAEVLETVRGTLLVEGARAKAMLALYDDYDLIDPHAEDPWSMFASQGFDPDHAVRECEAAKWIESHDLSWPPGLPLGKLRYLSGAAQKRLWAACSREEIQGLLDAAVDMPKADIQKKLVELGIRVTQPWFYVLFDPDEVGADQTKGTVMIVRTRDLESLLAATKKRKGRVVMQAQAWRQGWTCKRGMGGTILLADDGTEIPFEDLDEVGIDNSILLNRMESTVR